MKKRGLYILCWMVCVLAFIGCDRNGSGLLPGDKVRVQFRLPGSYAIPETGRVVDTKAVEHSELKNEMLELLEDGSTLWLAVYEKKEDGTYNDKPTELKSYVVRRVGDEYSTLYTCTVDSEGNVTSETDVPLYLEVGKSYMFRAISPARKLIDETKLHIKNGDYLLATDDRYTQTMAKEITINGENNSSGVTFVQLNPLLQQTAQMSFKIKTGENVHHLAILPAGIEISGIQDDILHDNSYNWTTSEPLKMYLGHKDSRISIKEFKMDTEGSIIGKVSVLPTDAVSSSIVVLLNLEVNAINSQYTMMLNRMILESAHSYDFEISVKVQNGVTVAVWQNQSWGCDVELKPVGQNL